MLPRTNQILMGTRSRIKQSACSVRGLTLDTILYTKYSIVRRKIISVNKSGFLSTKKKNQGSGGGRVVKLLACGARGPGFDSRHLNFQRLVISFFQVAIWLKYC